MSALKEAWEVMMEQTREERGSDRHLQNLSDKEELSDVDPEAWWWWGGGGGGVTCLMSYGIAIIIIIIIIIIVIIIMTPTIPKTPPQLPPLVCVFYRSIPVHPSKTSYNSFSSLPTPHFYLLPSQAI
ncbi:hypothetical protein E2C01_045501 [Portunus trituberculatus]|uniref:Uncharacterized protein n=1 Tax=Portunus trituberculatus TaxID=210409 RepID=A0A5B7FV57_PORTR|nr:hypothetical protein [Portunus trituberculatus]